jgi:hypothetical protein
MPSFMDRDQDENARGIRQKNDEEVLHTDPGSLV